MLTSNLSIVPAVIPPLSEKRSLQWKKYLTTCETRTNICPVRKHAKINDGKVTEYLVDIALISKDGWHQNRATDCIANKISELANQLATCQEGLKIGLCTALGPDGDLPLRWGNNRLRATEQNNNNGLAIANMPVGKIWVSIYDLPTSEIRKWQITENNLHDVSSPATQNDNVLGLKEMVCQGLLDDSTSKFVDCNDEEKDNRLKLIIKETMPHWNTPYRIKSLIKQYRRQNTNTYRVGSYTVEEMKSYFKANCPLNGVLDFSSYVESNKNIIKRKLRDGSERLSKILFTHASSADLGGALFQTAMRDKFVDPECDEIVVVSCHNHKAEVGLNAAREDREALVVKWNDALPGGTRTKLVDKIFVLPQTALEKKGGNFISKKSL
tara:strand:+ start:5661 stop:6809 length:1149 start_codon:yes stop_codon:yes gene_type:complete